MKFFSSLDFLGLYFLLSLLRGQRMGGENRKGVNTYNKIVFKEIVSERRIKSCTKCL